MKNRESALAVQGGQKLVGAFVDKVQPHFLAVRFFYKMVKQQFLVKGACDLGFKNRVVVMHEWVGFCRIP